jgi:hypothetical protein
LVAVFDPMFQYGCFDMKFQVVHCRYPTTALFIHSNAYSVYTRNLLILSLRAAALLVQHRFVLDWCQHRVDDTSLLNKLVTGGTGCKRAIMESNWT